MRIIKVIVAVILTAVAIKSCDIDLPIVSREALVTSQREAGEANKALQSVQDNYARQNRELSSILEELTELSCQTTSLQLNPETGGRQLTQAEKIDDRLDAVRDRIDRLEREAERARKLDDEMTLSLKTIRQLRTTVSNQQKDIDRLRAAISDKDATIRTQSTCISVQKDTISEQMHTILNQKNELKRALDCQTEMVYQAGCVFERLGDDAEQALNVTGKKDREMVRRYKKSIYENASQYYHTAASMNHSGAKGRCEVITYKLTTL